MPSNVLIDTWWNVNKVKAKVFEEGKPVLIDTWWNVNEKNLKIFKKRNCVLIDTWWNVNDEYIIAHANIIKGFNRYMVECEFAQPVMSQAYSAF